MTWTKIFGIIFIFSVFIMMILAGTRFANNINNITEKERIFCEQNNGEFIPKPYTTDLCIVENKTLKITCGEKQCGFSE